MRRVKLVFTIGARLVDHAGVRYVSQGSAMVRVDGHSPGGESSWCWEWSAEINVERPNLPDRSVHLLSCVSSLFIYRTAQLVQCTEVERWGRCMRLSMKGIAALAFSGFELTSRLADNMEQCRVLIQNGRIAGWSMEYSSEPVLTGFVDPVAVLGALNWKPGGEGAEPPERAAEAARGSADCADRNEA